MQQSTSHPNIIQVYSTFSRVQLWQKPDGRFLLLPAQPPPPQQQQQQQAEADGGYRRSETDSRQARDPTVSCPEGPFPERTP